MQKKGVVDGASARGYAISNTWKYIDENHPAARNRLLEQRSPEVRETVGKYSDIEFYPFFHWSEAMAGHRLALERRRSSGASARTLR